MRFGCVLVVSGDDLGWTKESSTMPRSPSLSGSTFLNFNDNDPSLLVRLNISTNILSALDSDVLVKSSNIFSLRDISHGHEYMVLYQSHR